MKKRKSSFQDMVNKQFGDGTIHYLDDSFKVEVVPIPFGVSSLDNAIGVGGLPLGRIVEIFGAPSAGKTTLCLMLIKEAQKLAKQKGHPLYGKEVAFLDVEHALDFTHAEALGVNLDELTFSQPDSGEQIFDLIDIAASSGEVGVIIVDSVAAMASSKELDEGMDYNPIGMQARLMSQGLRKVKGPIAKSEMLVIFINQTRSTMSMYGDPNTTSGGVSLDFYSSIRIKVSKKEIKNKDIVIGQDITTKIIKNKVSRPGKSTTFTYMFESGVDIFRDIVVTAIDMDIIFNRGAYYFIGSDRTDTKSALQDGAGNKMLWQGKPALEETLRQSPELFKWLDDLVQGRIPKESLFVEETPEEQSAVPEEML